MSPGGERAEEEEFLKSYLYLVAHQIRHLIESFCAHVALVRSLVRMREDVIT